MPITVPSDNFCFELNGTKASKHNLLVMSLLLYNWNTTFFFVVSLFLDYSKKLTDKHILSTANFSLLISEQKYTWVKLFHIVCMKILNLIPR